MLYSKTNSFVYFRSSESEPEAKKARGASAYGEVICIYVNLVNYSLIILILTQILTPQYPPPLINLFSRAGVDDTSVDSIFNIP